MNTILISIALLVLACLPCSSARAADAAAAATAQASCVAPARWHVLDQNGPRAIAGSELIARMARRDVVLLGEHHDERDHHLWQLQTLAALHAARPDMVIGFESFPRRVQPVLDRWTAGEIDASRFLREVEWDRIWGLPPDLYLPLLHFARINRIPVIALNVEKSLTEAIAARGLDAIAPAQREGVTRPAAASSEYERYLFDVYKNHARAGTAGAAPTPRDSAFRRFVEAQTMWDRAMAEALATRVKSAASKPPLAVGIVGAGHVRNGYGVAHQLRDLGVERVGTLLPLDSRSDCSELNHGYADAVYALPRVPREPTPPRLGVRLEVRENAVTIAAVEKGGLAERSGLAAGDVIVTVAGAPASISRVTAAIRGAPAGMWLPLEVRRGSDSLEVVVKLPPNAPAESHEPASPAAMK